MLEAPVLVLELLEPPRLCSRPAARPSSTSPRGWAAPCAPRQLYARIGNAYGGMKRFKQNLGRERALRVAAISGAARPLQSATRPPFRALWRRRRPVP